MNEKKFIRTVVDRLRCNPDAVVIRHEDKFTKGVPDVSMTGYGRTIWLEFKWVEDSVIKRFLKTGKLPMKPFSKLQLHQMMKLNKFGVARYVIGSKREGSLLLYPDDVRNSIVKGLGKHLDECIVYVGNYYNLIAEIGLLIS